MQVLSRGIKRAEVVYKQLGESDQEEVLLKKYVSRKCGTGISEYCEDVEERWGYEGTEDG